LFAHPSVSIPVEIMNISFSETLAVIVTIIGTRPVWQREIATIVGIPRAIADRSRY
jgi:hypothetical protein